MQVLDRPDSESVWHRADMKAHFSRLKGLFAILLSAYSCRLNICHGPLYC